MKIKVTRKFVNQYGKIKIRIPNSGYLFPSCSADWYNCGVYGWNWNAWNMSDFIVIEGYRSFPNCITADHDLFQEYNRKAKEFNTVDPEVLSALQEEFCKKVMELI
jgi:hypothetical protein